MQSNWDFAVLDQAHLDMVIEAERTLGADYVVAYAPRGDAAQGPVPPPEYEPAPLDESRLECLQGLEQKLDAVLVAYRQR